MKLIKRLWKCFLKLFRKKLEVIPTGVTSSIINSYSQTEPYYQNFKNYGRKNEIGIWEMPEIYLH